MSATLRQIDGDEYALEIEDASGASVSARGTLQEISFEVLLPLLPVLPSTAAPTPVITIRRVDDDEYTVVSQGGVIGLNLRAPLEPLVAGLRATVVLIHQVARVLPRVALAPVPATPSPSTRQPETPPRTRLRKKAVASTIVTRSMVRSALLSRRRKADEVAPLPPSNRRRKVIPLESDDEASDDDEDSDYESDAGSFIVPDEEASDDGSDAELPPVEESDDEQTMFARMRNNNMDEYTAFCRYMKYLDDGESIPASETAVRRVADYPMQLANSIAKSSLWSDDLIGKLNAAVHVVDRELPSKSEGECQVCSRVRTVSHEVNLYTRWGATTLPMASYKCGATCARRLMAYRQLVVLRDRMCAVYDDGDDAALQHCWKLRRDAIAAAVTFSKRDDDTD